MAGRSSYSWVGKQSQASKTSTSITLTSRTITAGRSGRKSSEIRFIQSPSLYPSLSALPTPSTKFSPAAKVTLFGEIRLAKRKGGRNSLMMIAILHLLLACGLIDLGMFLGIRFSHYGRVWPDSYEKLSISEYHWFRDQIRSIRLLYSPAAITIGLMIFLPKIIYLFTIFFSDISFWRVAVVDCAIASLAAIYFCITGMHAYIILNRISRINIGDSDDILCYLIRGPREKASQSLRDRCLLVAYKMFGSHLSMQSIIALFVIIVCIIDMIYFFHDMKQNKPKKQLKSGTT